jgi:cytochrome c2
MQKLITVLLVLVLVAFLGILTAALRSGTTPLAAAQQIAGAQPEEGRQIIGKYGCGGCHTIPGVPRAQGRVGPLLRDFRSQAYIAGLLPNNATNLIRWIQAPQQVAPGTAMPDLGVTEADARNIAAYLYSLK